MRNMDLRDFYPALEQAAQWPIFRKRLVIAGLTCCLMGLGYLIFLAPQYQELRRLKAEARRLESLFQTKQNKSKALRAYVKELAQKAAFAEYALTELQLVGLLEKNKEKWGIIQQPTGLVTALHAGDYLGMEHARVHAVFKNRMLLELQDYKAGKLQRQKLVLTLKKDA